MFSKLIVLSKVDSVLKSSFERIISEIFTHIKLSLIFNYQHLSIGCSKSKADSAEDAALPPLSLTVLTIPPISSNSFFQEIQVGTLEAKFKIAFGPDNKSLSFDEFKEAFKEDPAWKEFWDKDSLLFNFLHQYFTDERKLGQGYSIILSPGDASVKVRVLYDTLQDNNNQEFISTNDKDFKCI